MQDRHFIAIGAFNMCLAIAAGAFGAHALKQILSTEMLVVWQTAANYHIAHSLGLILIGILLPRFHTPKIKIAGIAMIIGIFLFSGSLYLLAITGIKILGAITPLGGVAFLIAWGLLGFAALKSNLKS
jgi:uncharacterized membrane protein YgdD (TMEM256/DUF423 family)